MPSLGTFYPILPGKLDAWREMVAQAQGSRRVEFEETLRSAGVTKVSIWLQQTAEGDFEVFYFEANDPARLNEIVATSSSSFAAWARETDLDVHGLDMTAPQPPPSELMLHMELN